MRSFWCLSLVALGLMSTFLSAQDTSEKPWFDLENCAFCKNMSSQPGLMESIKCDTIKLDNGMMMVSFIPDELKEAMSKANKGMEATVKQLEAGKQLPLCGFCECFGNLLMQGTKLQKKHGDNSEVTLLTSDDPEIIKQIHTMADRVNKERNQLIETIRKKSETAKGGK